VKPAMPFFAAEEASFSDEIEGFSAGEVMRGRVKRIPSFMVEVFEVVG
jgi:hypothetical protein